MARKPPQSAEERLVRAQKSMAPGSLGGRVASAAPMTLDVTRLDPRLRTSQKPPGGFDPNVDPVVIGSGADGGGVTHGVVIGIDATITVIGATAVGPFAEANGFDGVAIGVGLAQPNYSIAVGDAKVLNAAQYGICIGSQAIVGHVTLAVGYGGVAVGADTRVTADYATAIGFGAVATKDHQIVLGTALEFVEIPGSGLVLTDTVTGTRYILQITSGAIVLNAAP